MNTVRHVEVDADEAGMRLDRWFKTHYPGLGFGALQKLLRTGQVRVDGGRAKADTRIEAGQKIRVPPLGVDHVGEHGSAAPSSPCKGLDDAAMLESMLLYEDDRVIVLN